MPLTFLDLFAGGGGLSEGFIRAGFSPVAHVEADKAACFTLKTRTAYHWLTQQGRHDRYIDYLQGNISRSDLYDSVPPSEIASVINAEIGQESLSTIFDTVDELLNGRELDLIIGGPPCQAYSLVGRSRDKNKMRGDKRNYLYTFYAEFLRRYRPRYFVFENVAGLLSAKAPDGDLYFDKMRFLFKEVGYETEHNILSASNYGVLQNRSRIILVGKRGMTTGFYPNPETWMPINVVVNEVFKDLPPLCAGQGSVRPCEVKPYQGTYLYKAAIKNDLFPVTFHSARTQNDRDLEIYKIAITKWNKSHERLDYNDLPEHLKTHENRTSFLDRFKVIAGDMPFSHTIVAHISQDGHFSIHPDIEQCRSLTPREAARLQTFPDDYFFESTTDIPGRSPAFRQIGNAVPVLLAQKIAQKLLEVW
ncbi:DNA cytosine methyltransferase [Geomonas ferrireducens]|uniref:DNA cytosine methyltransferase n=1 Tax=Geomonas ferrireducens TaxID=2570227 RepID=UPI0010A8ED43|nr:DNA cytosine methyltransferase [Geomonas ferrireducens]